MPNPTHILAADDSAAMRQIIAATLADAGHQVSVAADGEQALHAARERCFDLVLTDQHMPGLDGLGLVRALRQLAPYDDVPVLLLTTESGEAFKAAARAAGATGLIMKPLDPAALNRVIATLLG